MDAGKEENWRWAGRVGRDRQIWDNRDLLEPMSSSSRQGGQRISINQALKLLQLIVRCMSCNQVPRVTSSSPSWRCSQTASDFLNFPTRSQYIPFLFDIRVCSNYILFVSKLKSHAKNWFSYFFLLKLVGNFAWSLLCLLDLSGQPFSLWFLKLYQCAQDPGLLCSQNRQTSVSSLLSPLLEQMGSLLGKVFFTL